MGKWFPGRVVLLLLVAAIVLNLLGLYLFFRVDDMVHNDLYNYGLTYSEEWADPYWSNSTLFMTCIEAAIILAGGAVIAYILFSEEEGKLAKWTIILLPFAAAIAGLFGIYYFSKIDLIVHSTLYEYGLLFSNDWAIPYWNNARALLACTGVAAALSAVAGLIVSKSKRTEVQPKKEGKKKKSKK